MDLARIRADGYGMAHAAAAAGHEDALRLLLTLPHGPSCWSGGALTFDDTSPLLLAAQHQGCAAVLLSPELVD